jgi:hypothetical protein
VVAFFWSTLLSPDCRPQNGVLGKPRLYCAASGVQSGVQSGDMKKVVYGTKYATPLEPFQRCESHNRLEEREDVTAPRQYAECSEFQDSPDLTLDQCQTPLVCVLLISLSPCLRAALSRERLRARRFMILESIADAAHSGHGSSSFWELFWIEYLRPWLVGHKGVSLYPRIPRQS